MLDSALVYVGLLLVALGAISLVWPLKILRLRTRARGALLIAGGALLAVIALFWPFSTSTASQQTTLLDEFMPEWQFGETHHARIGATPEQVFAAIRSVTADEIPLFQLLTSIRRGGRTGPESILNAPGQKPLLDVATATTFVLLGEVRPRELVMGTVIATPARHPSGGRLSDRLFRGRPDPGVTLAAMNFVVIAEGGGSHVFTETRVRSGDAAAARRFGVYWRIIHPGSDIIRRMWLRAVKRRAERR